MLDHTPPSDMPVISVACPWGGIIYRTIVRSLCTAEMIQITMWNATVIMTFSKIPIIMLGVQEYTQYLGFPKRFHTIHPLPMHLNFDPCRPVLGSPPGCYWVSLAILYVGEIHG